VSRRVAGEDGSTIPLILGFVVIAGLVVAGGVAAGDAFVDQRAVQSTCDGATLAAASAVDTGAVRSGSGAPRAGSAVQLGAVQQAAAAYLARDGARADVAITSTLSADGLRVESTCVQVVPVTFGGAFGFGDGVRHVVTSSAATVLR
jgi:hypothetical protein